MKNKMLMVAGAITVATLATTSVFADFGRGMLPQISQEEKTKIEAMSQEERQTYFETKKAEMQTKMASHKSVIDKLLNGETLTAEDQKVVEEIKAHRALHTEKRLEMEAKRVQMDSIKTKLQNNETLSDEEQAIVDEMKSGYKRWNFAPQGKKSWMEGKTMKRNFSKERWFSKNLVWE